MTRTGSWSITAASSSESHKTRAARFQRVRAAKGRKRMGLPVPPRTPANWRHACLLKEVVQAGAPPRDAQPVRYVSFVIAMLAGFDGIEERAVRERLPQGDDGCDRADRRCRIRAGHLGPPGLHPGRSHPGANVLVLDRGQEPGVDERVTHETVTPVEQEQPVVTPDPVPGVEVAVHERVRDGAGREGGHAIRKIRCQLVQGAKLVAPQGRAHVASREKRLEPTREPARAAIRHADRQEIAGSIRPVNLESHQCTNHPGQRFLVGIPQHIGPEVLEEQRTQTLVGCDDARDDGRPLACEQGDNSRLMREEPRDGLAPQDAIRRRQLQHG